MTPSPALNGLAELFCCHRLHKYCHKPKHAQDEALQKINIQTQSNPYVAFLGVGLPGIDSSLIALLILPSSPPLPNNEPSPPLSFPDRIDQARRDGVPAREGVRGS
jgi:hypothetical protein